MNELTRPRTVLHLALAAALVLAAAPAAAQLSPRAVALETGVSAPLGAGRGAHAVHAVSAAFWLEGALELTLRVAGGTVARTPDRAAGGWLSGTAGLRWSLAPGPLRPQVGLEAGWARAGSGGDRLVAGATAGLEWFPARDVALHAGCALRLSPREAGWRLEAGAGAALYF